MGFLLRQRPCRRRTDTGVTLASVNRRQVLQAITVAALLMLAVFAGNALPAGGATPIPLPMARSTQPLVVIGTLV